MVRRQQPLGYNCHLRLSACFLLAARRANAASNQTLGEVAGAAAPHRLKNAPSQIYGGKRVSAAAPEERAALIEAADASENRKIGHANWKEPRPLFTVTVQGKDYKVGTSSAGAGLAMQLGAPICHKHGIPSDLLNKFNALRRRVRRVGSASSRWDASVEVRMDGAAWEYTDEGLRKELEPWGIKMVEKRW